MTLINLLFALCLCTFASCLTVSDNEADSLLIGPEVCENGPEAWCLNLTTAVQCNAVKHCVQTVWSKAKLLQTDSCSGCETQIDGCRRGSLNQILQTLDTICETEECKRSIGKNINELLTLLNSDTESKTICHILNLCPVLKSSAAVEDGAVLYYKDIVLHFPAANIKILDVLSPQDSKVTHPPQLLGAEKCTWGPGYWCGNLTTSRKCGSTSHCIRNVWPRTEFKEDGDSVCQVCKDMVKQARDQLLSNETQEELKEVFEGSCKLIPIKEVRKECIALADEFVPELTEMLASEMNPTAVCTVAGLCNSPRIDNLLAAESKAVDFSGVDSCVNCTVAFTSFHRYLRVAPKNDVLQRMLAVCDELSSYSDLCVSLVVTNFDDLYDTITDQLQPFAACHLSGMCSFKYHSHLKNEDVNFESKVNTMLAANNDDLPCDFCKQLVTHLKDILVANTTEEEFLEVLHGMCQQTGKFKDECMQIVDQNFQVIYKFLTQELNADELCKAINICPRARSLLDDQRVNIISGSGRLVPVFAAEVNFTSLSPLSVPRLADVECLFCKTIVAQVEELMKNPTIEHDVEAALKNVCTLVPASDKPKCKKFVDVYAATLIKLLSSQTDPKVICALINVCPDTEAASAKGEVCSFCQYLLHYLQVVLDDPKEQTTIEQALQKVCAVIPQAEQNMCDHFIANYTSVLTSILAQEVDPSLICPALKLCPGLQNPRTRCNHCQVLMTALIDQLEGNTQPANIETALKALMPPKGDEKKAVALELQGTRRDDLIDMIAAEFDPDESCVYLEFCDTSLLLTDGEAAAIGGDVQTNDISQVHSKPSCEICEMFVKMYEKELTSNQTEEELEEMFDKLCSKLQNPDLKDKCTESVAKYVPLILDLLKKDVTPKELCAAAKLCSLRSLTDTVENECRACELAVGGLEGILGDPTYTNTVVERALQMCNYMSGRSQQICSVLVEELLPQVEGIAFGIPSWFVCTKMKMCPYADRLDAESVCSSPERWCQDVKSAFLCDKLTYCQKMAWRDMRN